MSENAWAAGLFEGEGTITLSRYPRGRKVYTRPVVTLTMTDRWVVDLFQSRWGGSIYEFQPKGNARLAWCWTLNSRRPIRAFLADVGMEFRTSRVRDKAALLIEDMNDRVQGSKNDDTYLDRCFERHLRMKALNKRGTS